MPVSTYVEVQFHYGTDGQEEWYAAADGHSGGTPWRRNGPRPETGTCVSYRFTSELNSMALSSNPRLSIEGIGSYNLLRYEGGMLEVEGGREAFPSGPFLTAGTIVTLSLDESRQVSAGVPERAEIIGPAAGVTLEIQQPMRFEWIPRRNERDYVSLVLSLFSDSYGFRGAVNCHVPDTGMFEMPAISSGDLEPDIRLAALQLRTEHQGESVFEDVKVDLYVRQTSSRAYAATLE